ncbi:NHL repeat-containing protein [Streptomyces sp. NPDC005529]|uniref:NHL repeat-containing protein n=1 Tax=unclassified Streptomyces TaxID=2593676 RepID=UPI0033BC3DF6
MSTPIPDDVWIQITNRLPDIEDVSTVSSVNRTLYDRLRGNPGTWQEHLNASTDTQLQHVASIAPALRETVERLLRLRAMTTLAGTGQSGFSGDGGPAHHATLSTPRSMAVGPDGSLYIADTFNHRIRRIAADGTITTLAGTGQSGFSGDDGPAHHATLHCPEGVAVGPDGTVHIVDTFNHRVRRIAADATITTLAGTGQPGFSGDDGPAHHAQLHFPTNVAVGPDGTVYIADISNHRVRRVTTNGIITTVAGTGQHGYGGDGGPAHHAALAAPRSMAVGPEGSLYIADTFNHRIRRIAADGTITTLAGTGQSGFSGDDGPAHHATLSAPRSLAVRSDGTVYVADMFNHRIRRIAADATITTLAGTGQPGFSGDDGPAHHATLSAPHAVTVGSGGFVHVITGHRLRRFGTPHC